MATQGMISITRDGNVVRKIIAGCDGFNASLVAKKIMEDLIFDLQELFDLCLENNFGCSDCLVVQSKKEYISMERIDKIGNKLYEERFEDPKFNPRWECGSVGHLTIIDLKLKLIN